MGIVINCDISDILQHSRIDFYMPEVDGGDIEIIASLEDQEFIETTLEKILEDKFKKKEDYEILIEFIEFYKKERFKCS